MPRSTHQKFVLHPLFPILTPQSPFSSSLSTYFHLHFHFISLFLPGYIRRLRFVPLTGNLLRIFVFFCLSYLIHWWASTRTSHGTSQNADTRPNSCRNRFFNTLLKEYLLFRLLPPSFAYPTQKSLVPLYTTSQHSPKKIFAFSYVFPFSIGKSSPLDTCYSIGSINILVLFNSNSWRLQKNWGFVSPSWYQLWTVRPSQ